MQQLSFIFERSINKFNEEKKKGLEKGHFKDADLVIEIVKDKKFVVMNRDPVNKAKLDLLESAGLYIPMIDFDVYDYVLGKTGSLIEDLGNLVLTHKFSEDAEKIIKRLKKELQRRNIPLQIDVDESDMEVIDLN